MKQTFLTDFVYYGYNIHIVYIKTKLYSKLIGVILFIKHDMKRSTNKNYSNKTENPVKKKINFFYK